MLFFKIAVFILFLLANYFLFFGSGSVDLSRSLKALWNLGHVVYFAFITLIFLQFTAIRTKSYASIVLWVVLLSTVLGFLIEILQYGTARNADILDVLHDVLGSLLILAFYKPIQPIKAKSILWFRCVVSIITLWALWPFTIALYDEINAQRSFPVLADFSSSLELDRWHGNTTFKLKKLNEDYPHTLQVTFDTENSSSIGLEYFPKDWSAYQYLNLNVYNPKQKPLKLVLRVHDHQHKPNYIYNDRFNKRLNIAYGWSHLKIPLYEIKYAPRGREMDLTRVENVSIFTSRLAKPEVLYLDSVYLSL